MDAILKPASAIIVAGGSGTRFDSKLPKQFIDLCGKSILQHSLELFEQIQCIHETLLVLPQKYIGQHLNYIQPANLTKLKPAIAGGERRQDSVYNALCNVSPNSEIVLIHDAVRPLASIELINKVIECANSAPGAILAAPVHDTLKKTTGEKIISQTLDRSEIWHAQTPQAFNLELLNKAYQKIIQQQIEITDEAQAMEHSAHKITIIESTKENLKITTQLDLKIAQMILKNR